MSLLPVAFSLCPNDTFLFSAWANGYVGNEFPLQATLADIQQLNEWALKSAFPLIKISLGILDQIPQDYCLLPIGMALGFGNGPKVIAKKGFSLENLTSKIVAIPGEHTTAHLLLKRLLPPPKGKIFCTYNEIFSLINEEKADCGLIIHESRFSYIKEGFVEIADLGLLWENIYHLPLPLGGIVAKKSLNLPQIISLLKNSLNFAFQNFDLCKDYILSFSQEKDLTMIKDHIALYVNEETKAISQKGKESIDLLLGKKYTCHY